MRKRFRHKRHIAKINFPTNCYKQIVKIFLYNKSKSKLKFIICIRIYMTYIKIYCMHI